MDSGYFPLEIIDHTADLGAVARGADLNSLFRNAALGMTGLLVSGKPGSPSGSRTVTIDGTDLTDLFVKWLGEILYLLQGEYLITADVSVKSVTPDRLVAEVDLVDFDPARHGIINDIKAVTYHQSLVSKDGALWRGHVIFDL